MDVNTFLSHRRSLATPSGEIACTEFGEGPAALFGDPKAQLGRLRAPLASE